jgi:hypothetical protein
MTTPFDEAIAAVRRAGYHNHRLETHSDLISNGIVRDLTASCDAFRSDLDAGVVKIWMNVASPGDRERKVDLFVGEPDANGNPDIEKVRIAVENKSVVTAHRNRTNRFDDLKKVLGAVQGARPEALLIATILIGIAERVLNVPDHVHKIFRGRESEFNESVLPRLSTGDSTLFDEFHWAISKNRSQDPAKTVQLFRSLPTRGPAQTHLVAYDSVLLVPVYIDNVNPPEIPRPNALGIDVDAEYQQFIVRTCKAYTARYHM